MSDFKPALAYWNQRHALAASRSRIAALSAAVNHPSDLPPYQFAQLLAAAMDYHPDLILELGRGYGNSTCLFLEASAQRGGSIQILSICRSPEWDSNTRPRLRGVVPSNWFRPLRIERGDILQFDYRKALSGAARVLVFWDAHGFDVAECVLGEILPLLASTEHLVLMHDLSDNRFVAPENLSYGDSGLWRGNDWGGRRLQLGFIDSAIEQAISAVDFTTRNRLTLDSADHSIHTDLSAEQQTEMGSLLGDLFNTQGHWFYFTLNEHPGPYTFPRYQKPVSRKE